MLTCRFCNSSLEVDKVIEGDDGVIELYVCSECGRTGRHEIDFLTDSINRVGSIF
ncbi:hypothetical protein JCM16358_11530 [Halanaerocella petrolearia]